MYYYAAHHALSLYHQNYVIIMYSIILNKNIILKLQLYAVTRDQLLSGLTGA